MEYSSMEELETKIDTNLVEFRKILNQLSDLGLFKVASDLSII